MNKLSIFIVSILCFILGLSLWFLIDYNPLENSAVKVGTRAPEFSVSTLMNPKVTLTDNDFKGHYSLVNFWASWCYSCIYEHKLLEKIKKEPKLQLFGINYMDSSIEAKQFLKTYGNPYSKVAEDERGHIGIIWGVYGTPETFLIDPSGVIIFHQTGPITPKIWVNQIKPLMR